MVSSNSQEFEVDWNLSLSDLSRPAIYKTWCDSIFLKLRSNVMKSAAIMGFSDFQILKCKPKTSIVRRKALNSIFVFFERQDCFFK